MPKKPFMEDIHPPHKRSIQDIPLSREVEKPLKKKVVRKKVSIEKDVSIDAPIFSDFDPIYSHEAKPRWNKIGLWLFILIVCVGGGLFASSFFHSATVGVKVKQVTSQIDTEVKLSRTAGSEILPFEIVSLSKEISQSVPAQSEKQVSSKASGKVVIYNKNSTSQKLLAQTRLESPQGKIYRTGTTVVVPAAKKVGASIVPGSVEVLVTADAPGVDYNSGLVDFLIPGFKGTAKYQNIYGRSKTLIEGGMLGTVRVANAEDLSKAESDLEQNLKQQLIESVNQQKPETFTLFADMYSIHYATSTQESKSDSVELKKKAEFVGILVNSQTLANFLAAKSIRGYSGEDVSVVNMQELTFSPSIAASSLKTDTSEFSVAVKGKPDFVYLYSVEKLKKDLSGMSRESFPMIVATYPGIEKGDVKIDPFWRTSFPQDVAKITINQE